MTRVWLIMLVVIMGLTACGNNENEEVVIAEQYGLAYAPIQIAKELGYFEANMPEGVSVKYAKLANTAAIRESMLGGSLDVGFMGIPPFLIGRDQGMDWKIMMGLNRSPLGLVVKNPDITSPEDLLTKGKIALPQPGSIQHILLSMYAKKTLGTADAFDQQLISMKHPDGYQALLNDPKVVAHFTAPPYIFQELDEEGSFLMVDGEEAMGGEFTFIVGVCEEDFYKEKAHYKAVTKSIEDAMAYMRDHPEETVQILSKVYELDETTVEDYIYNKGMVYETKVSGVETFIDFMYEAAYLEELVEESEVVW